MLEILKINNICLNQSQSKFILSFDKGVKIYYLKKVENDSISNSK